MAEAFEEVNSQNEDPAGNGVGEPVADPVLAALTALKEQFPYDLAEDSRERFSGILVSAEKLIEVSRHLRDELGFDYLSCVTGVDLLPEDKMEVVYHTFSTEKGGGPIVLKVQVGREEPSVPSLVKI